MAYYSQITCIQISHSENLKPEAIGLSQGCDTIRKRREKEEKLKIGKRWKKNMLIRKIEK